MMNYQDILDFARRAQPLQRVRIIGGQTRGYVKCLEEPQQPLYPPVPVKQGTDYANVYKTEDEVEEENMDKANNQNHQTTGMTCVEELSCAGSFIQNPLDIVNDDLVRVYDNYSFTATNDSSLLINRYKEEILDQIDVSPVTIIKGQTGCGKSTQVPQFILDRYVKYNIHCNIVVTQPRRIAAISIAKRVCSERNWLIGSIVGYQIALDKNASPDTRLLYCTTCVLLNQLIMKQSLLQYTHIIIDEVHERDQDTDFLLFVLKRFLRTPGCRTKVILMSATINTTKFSDYFSKKVNGVKVEPPVIELEHLVKYPVYYYYLDSLVGKFPIQIPQISLERPQIDASGFELASFLIEAFHTIDKSEHKQQDFIGSVLIFLPGIHEIEVMFEKLSKHNSSQANEKWWLCPLHSTITFDEQCKVFKLAPKGYRKIILATNIAESSITVPDVKYVIDFCLMKLCIQEVDTNYTSLQMAWISKSQGSQRAGRVGRIMPGRVYRLVPQQMYEELDEECTPEMLRSPLDQIVLRAKSLDIGSPVSILARALDPPDLTNIQRTILLLKEMGALLLTSKGKYEEDDGDLTFIGRIMAVLPLDTQLSKLIILGHMFSLLSDCIIMASAMAVKSIFSSPFKQQLEAYNSKLSWADSSCSDPIAFLNAYKVWRYHTNSGKFKRSLGSSESSWAKRYFIQLQSMREIAKLEGEIRNRLGAIGILEPTSDIESVQYVKWEESIERPIILKLVIAGAFYPNYFVRSPVDEKEAVKILGGRDPFSTVYLSGMPLNQPGLLYSSFIKRHFEHCGSQIKVSFDGSSKVYLQFGSSNPTNDMDLKPVTIPGKIMMAVYRAIKLRHLQIPIRIPLLLPKQAETRAKSLFGDYRIQTFCWSKKKEQHCKPSILPGFNISFMQVTISHIDSPGKFWVQLHNAACQKKIVRIHSTLNHYCLQGLREPPKISQLCVAPYTDETKFYYRAKITRFGPKNTVMVFFIDFGNSEYVSISELRDFSPEMIREGIRDEPEMAIECLLSEIQPSPLKNPKGTWSKDVITIFRNKFNGKLTVVQMYSVVDNIMSVILFLPECLTNPYASTHTENSFNNYLINEGYAEPVNEPYLSRKNHMLREMSFNSSESVPTSEVNEPFLLNDEVDAPPENECRLKVDLKGPKSPLEMSLYSVIRKSQGIDVGIEWSSVNSVLLDTYPMDLHERMMVGGTVTQNPAGDRLTLRNTTMMPNIHGLSSLIIMLFAPRVELRTDANRTHLTGAICGLGCDPQTKKPYNCENDIEITFDTKFELSDLETVNRLRYWMNSMVFGGNSWEEEVNKPGMASSQKRIQQNILKLLSRKCESVGTVLNPESYKWGLIDEDYLLHPHGIDDGGTEGEEDVTIFPLIWGVQLNTGLPADINVVNNLKQLTAYSEGSMALKGGVICKLCQMYLESLQSLRLHLQSSVHRESYKRFSLTT